MPAISESRPGLPSRRTGTVSKNVSASVTGNSTTSPMLLSCTVTDERFALEAASVALAARHLDHELLQLHANRVGLRLVVPPLDVREHAFPLDRVARRFLLPAARLSPYRIASRTVFGMSPHGVLRSNLS